jgi:hypothetical protein
MKILTPKEEEHYLRGPSPPLKDVAVVMVGTGMRPEEDLKLQDGNIDLAKRKIVSREERRMQLGDRYLPRVTSQG